MHLVAGQPTANGVLQVARVAAPEAGGVEKWDLKWDPWICNRTGVNYKSVTARASFVRGGVVTQSVSARLRTYSDANGNGYYYLLPAHSNATQGFFRPGEPNGSAPTLYSLPVPDKITFRLTVKESADSENDPIILVRTYDVAAQTTPGPLGGFFFPLRQSSLPPSSYYNIGYHDDWNLHNRYALDIGALRYDDQADKWTSYRATNTQNPFDPANNHHNAESWVMWGSEVRAMSDGEVVACTRGMPDNKPFYVDGEIDEDVQANQVNDPAGGNFVWIRNGDQTQVYAHMQKFSIPFDLCPYDDMVEHQVADPYSDPSTDAPYKVKAGQFLGLVGNSGNTSNPHTHVESIMGTSQVWGGENAEFFFGSDSRPMNFVNVKVQPWTGANIKATHWQELTAPRVLPYNTVISPNDCGYLPVAYNGKAEIEVHAVKATCWAQAYNTMIQAGLRPIHYDSHPSGTTRTITTVWRPNDGTAWQLAHGLTAAQLQDKADALKAAGYRYVDLQSYTVDGAVRYAAIWVKQPGAKQYAKAGMSLRTFNSEFATKTRQGYVMADYSVAVVNGVRQYTGLWVLKPSLSSAFYLVKDVKVANFQDMFDTQTAAGLMPVSLDGYELNGVAYLATVWHKNVADGWTALHDLAGAELITAETTNVLAHRYAGTLTEYGASAPHHFAAVWRPAPDTSIPLGPGGSTSSTTATFTFKSSNDPLATFECKLGGRAVYTECRSPVQYTSLTPATRTFYVRARSFDGVRDPSPATRTWTITAP